MTSETTHELVRFAVATEVADDVHRAALGAIWDVLQRATASTSRGDVDALLAVLPTRAHTNAARVPGLTAGLAAPHAAMVMAFAARLDARDGGGLEDTVVATSLALGQVVDAPVADVVDAVALGLEAGCRIGRVIKEEAAGWDHVGVAGPVAGACAAIRLVRPAEAVASQLLGLAATQGAGLGASRGTDGWPLHAGKAASNATEAALLAIFGFTGPSRGIEGRRGLVPVVAPDADLNGLTDGLGTRWELEAEMTGLGMFPAKVREMSSRAGVPLKELLDLSEEVLVDTR